MRETYQPPTTSPTGPPHDQKVSPTASSSTPTTSPAGPPYGHTHTRHSRTHPHRSHIRPRHSRTPTSFPHTHVIPAPVYVIPAPTHVIPAPTHVIPAQAGIHPAASKPTKRRPSSRRLQNSTKSDRILQNTTETRVRPRTRARGNLSRHSRVGGNPRARPRSVSFLSAWIVPRSQRIRHTAWSCRLTGIMPINRMEPHRPNGRHAPKPRAPRHTSPESMETAPHPLPVGDPERLGRETSNVQHPNREVLEICNSTS